jgi:N-acetylmuramoyl-L-alanine amidase
VTLGIGLKLGKLIEQQLPDVKVVYTRKTDRFIELYRRGQIANENGGKLFISIHANSLPMKPSPVNGFEIYLLRPGKTDEAIKIAEKENSVVRLEEDAQDRYQEITEENFIILTMAQSAYMKQSEHFAELLSDELSHKLSPQSRGVKQAGFYVLVGASMPNALVETGYLSNRNDEMFLRNPDGQQIIAESMLRSIQRYKRQYEETLKDEPVSAK